MKTIIKKLCKVLLSIAISVIFLSFIALIYENSGTKTTNTTGATPYKWEGKQFVSNMAEGYSWFFTDYDGFNNRRTFDNVDILIMGDSHMEGTQVYQNKTVASILNEILPNHNTYSIGISGTYFANSINNYENALKTYRPTQYVVFDASFQTITPDISLMNRIIDGEYENQGSSYESGIMYYLKRIPCVKPILYGLNNWRNQKTSSEEIHTIKNKIYYDEEYLSKVNGLLEIISLHSKEYSVKPIVVYFPEEKIDYYGTWYTTNNEAYLDSFSLMCEKNDIIFLDMTNDMKEFYEKENKLSHGFINSAVGAGHINENGHKLIAKRVANIIGEN